MAQWVDIGTDSKFRTCTKASNEGNIQKAIFKLSKLPQDIEAWSIGNKKAKIKLEICQRMPEDRQIKFNVSTEWDSTQHGKEVQWDIQS